VIAYQGLWPLDLCGGPFDLPAPREHMRLEEATALRGAGGACASGALPITRWEVDSEGHSIWSSHVTRWVPARTAPRSRCLTATCCFDPRSPEEVPAPRLGRPRGAHAMARCGTVRQSRRDSVLLPKACTNLSIAQRYTAAGITDHSSHGSACEQDSHIRLIGGNAAVPASGCDRSLTSSGAHRRRSAG
jgi:hypothetical protein